MRKSWLGKVGALALAGGVAQATHALETPVQVQQRWEGRVPAGVAPPPQSSLVAADALQVVWTLCQVQSPMPDIDFSRQIVLLAVRKGVKVRFQNAQVADGNVRTNVLATMAPAAQTFCALALVDRAGIKTVNGAPLGQ
ncbi:MAG: hypothetical protein U1F10_02095 [Burkholderiales bacterium]